MCPAPDEVETGTAKNVAPPAPSSSSGFNTVNIVLAVIAFIVTAELAAMIALEATRNDPKPATVVINNGDISASSPAQDAGSNAGDGSNVPDVGAFPSSGITGVNICADSNPRLANTECIVDSMVNVGPQAGANVTAGYIGGMAVDYQPITDDYYLNGMCPVNVHWHLGAEHYSLGEFDEEGDGPNGGDFGPDGVDGGVQPGYRCRHYDPLDPKFTTPYQWKHCVGMQVGETYEVHWPHSAAGACGTPNQYQTPFYDGVFCNIDVLDLATPGATAGQIGVQAQVFTIVNDENYFYPDLMRGMIKDGDYGQDIAKYTGSTTGSGRNNVVCSAYSPITWQVDRKCQLISASTFDKMCYDMKTQRDDMNNDLFAHGSRVLVDDALTANNQNRNLRKSA